MDDLKQMIAQLTLNQQQQMQKTDETSARLEAKFDDAMTQMRQTLSAEVKEEIAPQKATE